MIRLATLAALTPLVWLIRKARQAGSEFVVDDRGNRVRRIVREEIAAADAEWDEKAATNLGILGEAGYQRQAERLRAELDDPEAVARWLWSEGRA